MNTPSFTAPGISKETASTILDILGKRLTSLIDLQLTLKHVHWNVVGPNFIAVHEMLDPQVDGVRAMSDVVAERMATLGGTPLGTSGAVVKTRDWEDYSLGKATAIEHLAALDMVYTGINSSHREAISQLGEIDPVSEDVLVSQLGDLELYQWFVRAHLESSGGELAHAGATSEKDAASRV